MAVDTRSPVNVPLPRPVERPLRLGPFPSARDALKFAGYAAAGLVAVPVAGAAAIVPFAAAGFFFAVHRNDAGAVDERLLGYLAFRWRRSHPPSAGRPRPFPKASHVAALPEGRVGAVLRAGGIPVAFLPPEEARSLFEATQRWIHALDGSAYVVVGTVPIRSKLFRTSGVVAAAAPDLKARASYEEMVQILLQRRHAREVVVLLWERADPEGLRRLEGRVASAEESLRSLGVPVEHLTGPPLVRQLRRLGLLGGRLR